MNPDFNSMSDEEFLRYMNATLGETVELFDGSEDDYLPYSELEAECAHRGLDVLGY